MHISQYQYKPFPLEREDDLNVLSGFEWPQWKGTTKAKETLTPVEKKPIIKPLRKVKPTVKKQAKKDVEKRNVAVAQNQPQEALHPNTSPPPSNSMKSSTAPKTAKSMNKHQSIINGLADKILKRKTTK